MIASVGVIGGGAWGTALALTAARAGRKVTLWARNIAVANSVRQRHENPKHLPGVALDPPFNATAHLAETVGADALLLAVPAQTLRSVATAMARLVVPGTPVVICAKGLERGSTKRMSQVLAEAAPQVAVAVLSGPSFAMDVARGLPTAVTVAAEDEAIAAALCEALAVPSFRPYASTDVVGVEIGGAVKNVLAIAAGIVAGQRLGASAHAALIARGFAELRRLAEAMGGRPDTLMGLSGLGDLVLTASSPQSRNFSYGLALGEGGPRPGAHALVEGIETAAVARDLAARLGVDMPIVNGVAAVLAGQIAVPEAIAALMSRPLKRED